jgi:site-specific DNA-methyltransferase (adenine-specific)
MLQEDMRHKEERIHPCQKPVALYEWLLNTYAQEGDKILDTHLGSGSIAVACHNMGYDLDGYEINTKYYEDAKARLELEQRQMRLFV